MRARFVELEARRFDSTSIRSITEYQYGRGCSPITPLSGELVMLNIGAFPLVVMPRSCNSIASEQVTGKVI
jgi:hypothetical protein